MKKLILTGMAFLGVGLVLIGCASLFDPIIIWHRLLLVFGGIMVGVCASFLNLARLSENNPAIITEIEKLDNQT